MIGWQETSLFLDTFSKQSRAWRAAFLRMIFIASKFPPSGVGEVSPHEVPFGKSASSIQSLTLLTE